VEARGAATTGQARFYFPANKLRIGREAIEKNVMFLDN
jgi:hypothetical protein